MGRWSAALRTERRQACSRGDISRMCRLATMSTASVWGFAPI